MNDPFAKWRPHPTTKLVLDISHVEHWRTIERKDSKFGFAWYPTWPTSRRRRLPIGLHRDPMRNWTLSDEAVARGELKELKDSCGYWAEYDGLKFKCQIVEAVDIQAEFAKQVANWKATQDAAYRLRRDYAKVGK